MTIKGRIYDPDTRLWLVSADGALTTWTRNRARAGLYSYEDYEQNFQRYKFAALGEDEKMAAMGAPRLPGWE